MSLHDRGRRLVAGEAFAGAGGIVIRVRSRHGGVDGMAPVGEEVVQLFRAGRLALDQIALLTRVFGEVEELQAAVFVKFDQLPIAEADGSGGSASLIAVVRIMPEQRAL